jgi:hypothetical protein
MFTHPTSTTLFPVLSKLTVSVLSFEDLTDNSIIKKKCIAKIFQDNKSTSALTYIGLIGPYKKNKVELMQFYIYNDNIEQCMKGSRQKRIKSTLEVPYN